MPHALPDGTLVPTMDDYNALASQLYGLQASVNALVQQAESGGHAGIRATGVAVLHAMVKPYTMATVSLGWQPRQVTTTPECQTIPQGSGFMLISNHLPNGTAVHWTATS